MQLHGTTKYKPIADAQKIKIKQSKDSTTEHHQLIMEESMRRRKEQRNYKTARSMNKMAISTY